MSLFKFFVLWLILTPVAVVLFAAISICAGIAGITRPLTAFKAQFLSLWKRWCSFGTAMLEE